MEEILEIVLAVLRVLGVVVDAVIVAKAVKDVLLGRGEMVAVEPNVPSCDYDIDSMNDLDDGHSYIWNRP